MKKISFILLCFFCLPAFSQNWLTIHITGFKNDNGKAVLDLFTSSDGFPMKTEKADKRLTSVIKDGKATFTLSLESLKAYAFAVIHDENSNGELDTNFLGMPKEGACASNNAKGFLGPPDFEDAVFKMPQQNKTMQCKMIYF